MHYCYFVEIHVYYGHLPAAPHAPLSYLSQLSSAGKVGQLAGAEGAGSLLFLSFGYEQHTPRYVRGGNVGVTVTRMYRQGARLVFRDEEVGSSRLPLALRTNVR